MAMGLGPLSSWLRRRSAAGSILCSCLGYSMWPKSHRLNQGLSLTVSPYQLNPIPIAGPLMLRLALFFLNS